LQQLILQTKVEETDDRVKEVLNNPEFIDQMKNILSANWQKQE
jgi:hypothetical protein